MIEYKLVRKYVKNINLRVNKNGEVIVSAPYFCPRSFIDRFVLSKENWIEDKLKNLQYDTHSNSSFTNEDRKLFREKLEVLIPKWEETTGLYCSGFRIKNMTSRWGSCNPKTRNININIQLMNKPEDCLDYVIVHELCHLKVANHSKEFYNLVEKYIPNYKYLRKQLNSGDKQ